MSAPAEARKRKGKKSKTNLSKIEIADLHISSFEVCHRKGKIGQSFHHLASALVVLPSIKDTYYSSFLEVLESWSAEVEETHGFQEAVKLFEIALKHYPNSADVKYLLANILYRHGSVYEAWSYASLAHGDCSQDPNAQETCGRLANALINRWHIPMLNDLQRNTAFKGAIEKAVIEGYHDILDIGSGTGLLSVYAKRAGAENVYGCELDKFMCEIAISILNSNEGTDGIKIFNLHSHNLKIPQQLPNKVSLVVTETVDAGLFGENILCTLQHAWTHLLLPPPPSDRHADSKDNTWQHERVENPNIDANTSPENKKKPKRDLKLKYGKVIPSSAEVFVALINCKYIANCSKVENTDIVGHFRNKNKLLLKLDEPYMSEKLNEIPGGFKLLSKWTSVTQINFNSPRDIDDHLQGIADKTVDLTCTSEGTVDALVLAFNLQLDETHSIDTLPESCSIAWENALYPIFETRSVFLNDTVKVDFKCGKGIIDLSLHSETLVENYNKLYLNASALVFLNNDKLVNTMLNATKEMVSKFSNTSNRNNSHHIVVCDITPFPIAALCVLELHPNAQIYVEEEWIQKSLMEMGIQAKLTEDLEEEIDLLFLWPVTKEGTLQDGIIKKILMYRLMMSDNGMLFPDKLDLFVDAISSSAIQNMAQVDDSNTCGVKVAEVFNIAKTTHHVDMHLDELPHTSVLSRPIPILQLSLATGNVEALAQLSENNKEDLLVLGGDPITVVASERSTKTSAINALAYWFKLRSDATSVKSEITTREPSSLFKQSMFVLDNEYSLNKGDAFDIRVIWRDGIFSANITNFCRNTL